MTKQKVVVFDLYDTLLQDIKVDFQQSVSNRNEWCNWGLEWKVY